MQHKKVSPNGKGSLLGGRMLQRTKENYSYCAIQSLPNLSGPGGGDERIEERGLQKYTEMEVNVPYE